MKQLTPLQTLIEQLKVTNPDVHPVYKNAMEEAIEMATKILPSERKMVEDAYKTGREESGYLDYYPEKHSREYFDETFNTDKP